MRTMIVAVTCLALGAALNAPGTGANISDWAAEQNEVRQELQSTFNMIDREELEKLVVVKEWRNRRLAKRNSELLPENTRQGFEILELRNKLRKCEKRDVRKSAE